MVKVALDALGGDFAPDVVIEGAVNAVNKNARGSVRTGGRGQG